VDGDFDLNEQGFDVTWHTDKTVSICIVPFDIDTPKLISGHVELDPVKFLENVQDYDEAELDRTLFVAPETRGGFNFIVAFSEKAGSEEIVG